MASASPDIVSLIQVESAEHKSAARALIEEYLVWVGEIAEREYGLRFDIAAMLASDIDDQAKFYPPTGRMYLVQDQGANVGVGCLKRLPSGLGEIQRMYIQPHVRGVGAGRMLVNRLLHDARELGYPRVRLESLKALSAAHSLYRSVGFVETAPYADHSMNAYHAPEASATFDRSVVFMECVIAPVV
jgi:GNAT superfamily N-acetyltransferase